MVVLDGYDLWRNMTKIYSGRHLEKSQVFSSFTSLVLSINGDLAGFSINLPSICPSFRGWNSL